MLKLLAVIGAVLVAAVLLFATTRADSFHVQRSIVIHAPADKVFPLINNLHRWTSWSPYEMLDPAMQRTYGGAPEGTGASYAWNSKSKAGAGTMNITESTPSSQIIIALDFTKPFEGHNTAQFNLDSKADSTLVTWAMYGPTPYLAKVIGIFFNMDQLIGQDFELGLKNLKTVAETH